MKLHRLIFIFSIVSWLCINLYKISLIGVGMECEEVQFIASSLGCQVRTLHRWNLGLQLRGGHRDIQSWSWFDLNCELAHQVPFYWGGEGRLVFLCSVLSSTLLYKMLMNVPPKGVRCKLHGLYSQFQGVSG